ncbi:nuclear receptor corepressor 1-like [Pollicipes pollicipes]|uniref:nuclear receptor corepressor 1-like n=1 Tax=Pollicipes pollicipes TaxID=41117 RepID=UPI00188540D0|nr:nuclear receptor corepressor 1-like [Pollicipes pollicipes]
MKAESQIAKLKRKQSELEAHAGRPDDWTSDDDDKEARNTSLAQTIYADNRKRARTAKADLEKLGPLQPAEERADRWRLCAAAQPLYNQPSDAAVYRANAAAFRTFKRRLVATVRRRRLEDAARQRLTAALYAEKLAAWVREVERIEALPKSRQRAAKDREFYEKVFPEIRRSREERERFNRAGRLIKSDVEMEEVMDGIQEQENEKQKLLSLAVIPPPMLDEQRRARVFLNRGGRIAEPLVLHDDLANQNVWTEAERQTLDERYLQHPKQFHALSAALERKATSECVRHYYLSKKQQKYKERLKKARTRGRGRGGPHPCAVCQTQLEHHGQSRPLPAAHAASYGLSERDLPGDARVCAACRCRSVKRRYSHVKCPIPTCPTPKFRVKRLRPLPS